MQASKPIILVIEDEEDVRDLIVLHLKREGWEAVSVEDSEKAQTLLRDRAFSVAIVDWMLPGASGLDLLKWMKGDRITTPVLMVTARADATDIVRGLEAGADDYVTKPFDVPVLIARVRGLIRRSQQTKSDAPAAASSSVKTNAALKVGGLTLNSDTYEVLGFGQKIHLTPSEFKLLKSLMQSAGRVLSRDQLIELVQGEGVSVVDRAIDTHVFGLRKKLGELADFIETIRGVGYRMKAD